VDKELDIPVHTVRITTQVAAVDKELDIPVHTDRMSQRVIQTNSVCVNWYV